MKKLALVFTFFLSAVTAAHAQNRQGASAHQEEASVEAVATSETEKLNKLVTLTDAQRTSIMEINRKIASKEASQRRSGVREEQIRIDIGNVRRDMYLGQLNEEQKAKYMAAAAR